MALREVRKNLAGKEDLALGIGSEIQQRAGKEVEITHLNATHLEGAIIVDTIKDLLTLDLAKLQDGAKVYVLGFHQPNDGGGGLFYFDDSILSNEHNGGTIIDPNKIFPSIWPDSSWFSSSNIQYGAWKRILENAYIAPEIFGAKGDGITDDTLSLQKTVDYLVIDDDYETSQTTYTLILQKQYAITSLDIKNKLTIIGINKFTSGLIINGNYGIKLTNTQATNFYQMGFNLNNFFIKDSGNSNYGIVTDETTGIQSSTFNNLYIKGFKIGIYFKGGWLNTFRDIDIFNSGVGILLRTLDTSIACNQNTFENIRVQFFKRCGIVCNGRANEFKKCTIQVDSYDSTYVVNELSTDIEDGGIVIYKGNSDDGYVHTDVNDNVIDGCWFEVLSEYSIVIKGKDSTLQPKNNIITNVTASSSIEKAIKIINGNYTRIKNTNYYNPSSILYLREAWRTNLHNTYIATVDTDNANYYNWFTDFGNIYAIRSRLTITSTPNNAGNYYIQERSAGIDVTGVLSAENLGSGNIVNATTLGNVIKKMPIYDRSGNLLGYLPVYDDIS